MDEFEVDDANKTMNATDILIKQLNTFVVFDRNSIWQYSKDKFRQTLYFHGFSSDFFEKYMLKPCIDKVIGCFFIKFYLYLVCIERKIFYFSLYLFKFNCFNFVIGFQF